MFRRDQRRADPLWEVAASVQVFSASRLATGDGEHEWEGDGGNDGTLLARRHPTGWFLQAVRRDDLPRSELAAFRELVTVRAYLLLRVGPTTPVWERLPGEAGWCSRLPALEAHVAGLAGELRSGM